MGTLGSSYFEILLGIKLSDEALNGSRIFSTLVKHSVATGGINEVPNPVRYCSMAIGLALLLSDLEVDMNAEDIPDESKLAEDHLGLPLTTVGPGLDASDWEPRELLDGMTAAIYSEMETFIELSCAAWERHFIFQSNHLPKY